MYSPRKLLNVASAQFMKSVSHRGTDVLLKVDTLTPGLKSRTEQIVSVFHSGRRFTFTSLSINVSCFPFDIPLSARMCSLLQSDTAQILSSSNRGNSLCFTTQRTSTAASFPFLFATRDDALCCSAATTLSTTLFLFFISRKHSPFSYRGLSLVRSTLTSSRSSESPRLSPSPSSGIIHGLLRPLLFVRKHSWIPRRLTISQSIAGILQVMTALNQNISHVFDNVLYYAKKRQARIVSHSKFEI